MLNLVYLFFIAIINSIDNAGIGVSYSIAGVKIPTSKNILISFIAFVVSFISAISGGILSHFLNEQTASIISMLLLVFMGARMIYQSLFNKKDDQLEIVRIIGYKESITVGTVLALDDVGSSVSSGLIGYGPFIVSLPYFIVSFIIFFLANYGTSFFLKLNIGKKATIIAGVLMILMGILRLF